MLTEKFEIVKVDNGYILKEKDGVTVHLTDTALLWTLTETLNTTTNNKVSVTITIE